jgi:hypothetical protein
MGIQSEKGHQGTANTKRGGGITLMVEQAS